MDVDSSADQTLTLTLAQQRLRRFCEIRDKLREEINTRTGREDATQQMRVDAPRRVFQEHDNLLVELYSTAGGSARLCKRFPDRVLGVESRMSRARILAILLSTGIDPHKDSWTKFCKLLNLENEFRKSRGIFDKDLPLPRDEVARLLGEDVATGFYTQQRQYCMPDAAEVKIDLWDAITYRKVPPPVHNIRLPPPPSLQQPTTSKYTNMLVTPKSPESLPPTPVGRPTRMATGRFVLPPYTPHSVSDRPLLNSASLNAALGHDTTSLPAATYNGKSGNAGSPAKSADLQEKVAALRLAVNVRDDLKACNILCSGVDPGIITISHMPALHRMAEMMQPETIQTLLNLGVALDEPDGDGRTALLYALAQDRYDVARLLIERGARLDLPDNKGSTALHHAVRGVVRSHHADEVVTRLLAAPNALVSTQNQAGYTPLHICAQSCTPSACHYAEVLFDHDSTAVDLKNKSGYTPFQLVIHKKPGPDADRMLKLLLRPGTRSIALSESRGGVNTPQGPSLVPERVNLDKPVQSVWASNLKPSMRAAPLFPVVGPESDIRMDWLATVARDGVQPFVNILFSKEGSTVLSNAAINDWDVGNESYHKTLWRLLISFGANLEQEARTIEERSAGRFLRLYASTIADEIVKKTPVMKRKRSFYHGPEESLGDRLFGDIGNVRLSDLHNNLDAGPSGTSDGASAASDEISPAGAVETDEPEEDVFGEFLPLKGFILASAAYRAFLESMSGIIRSSYVERLDKMINVDFVDTTLAVQELRGLAFGRIWLSQHDVRFSFVETVSLEDRMKGHVEDCLGEHWDWWPLRPRSLPLKDGYTRVHWRCNCGEQRSADLKASIANELQVALQPTPAWIKVLSTSTPTVRPGGVPSASAPSTKAPSQHAAGVVAQATVPSSGSGVPGMSAAPIPSTAAFTQHGMSTQPTTTSEHVFLGARHGFDLRIADLQVQSMNDEEFFRRLKQDYRHLRGRLRLWLSWWRFDHCEFFRFEKFAEDEFVPRIADFPINLEYKYTPRPIDPQPPISKHEFRKRYYNSCNQPSSWHWPWHSCKKFCSRRSQALGAVPKRIRVLERGGDAREDFWGILAQERRYFAWVFGYFLLTLIPSSVFFFMWLFRWSHVNDLQNASVPITVTLGLWAVFAAVLWQDRAVVWED
ncbi:hypothetical protein LTR17_002391 [Elasticomyces elasticus]|nr:hypothetical protein LTR17_002391 [Elasticomyces elasticus]